MHIVLVVERDNPAFRGFFFVKVHVLRRGGASRLRDPNQKTRHKRYERWGYHIIILVVFLAVEFANASKNLVGGVGSRLKSSTERELRGDGRFHVEPVAFDER